MSNCYYPIGCSVRAEPPVRTLLKLQNQLLHFGITRVADITHLDVLGMPVFICIRPNAKHLSISQGKGCDMLSSTISAIMESIETYHVENPPAIDHVGSYHSLHQKLPVIDPMQFAQGVINKDLKNKPLSWVKARNLRNHTNVFLPHALCDFDSTQVRHQASFFNVSSNGLASGNTMEEAL